MGRVNIARTTWDWIKHKLDSHERRIRALETGHRIGNTAIDSGSLTITGGSVRLTFPGADPDDPAAVDLGEQDVLDEGNTIYGAIVRRRNGNALLGVGENIVAGKVYVLLFDELGHVIFANDIVSGEGIGVPFFNVPFADASVPAAGPVTVTGGSYVSVQEAFFTKFSPKITIQALQATQTGVTAQWRLLCNGDPIGSTFTSGAGAGYFLFEGVPLPGDYQSGIRLELQGRIASGTGSAAARVQGAWTHGS